MQFAKEDSKKPARSLVDLVWNKKLALHWFIECNACM